MGASRTGSGKTLCYLIPVIEKLYLNKWTSLDGLGALSNFQFFDNRITLPIYFIFIWKFIYNNVYLFYTLYSSIS